MQEITKDVIERLIAIKRKPCISVYTKKLLLSSKKMPIQLNLLNIIKKIYRKNMLWELAVLMNC